MSSSSAGGENTTFPRMFSSSADEVFRISMFAYLARCPANRLRIGRNVCDNSTIELQKQAAADRYYHQLHPKPWAKSPEEAALAVACSGALDPNWGRFWGEFFPSRGLWSMSGWCRGYWSSHGRVEKGWNWVAECNMRIPRIADRCSD